MMNAPIDIDQRRDAVRKALRRDTGPQAPCRRLLPRDLSPLMRQDAAVVLLTAWSEALRQGLSMRDASVEMLCIDRNGQIHFDGFDLLEPRGQSTPPLQPVFRQLIGPLLVVSRHPELAFMIQRSGPIDPAEFVALVRPAWRHAGVLPGVGRVLTSLMRSRYAPLLLAGSALRLVRAIWTERVRRSDAWLDGAIDALKTRMVRLAEPKYAGKWTGYYDGIDLRAYADTSLNFQEVLRDSRERKIFELLDAEDASAVLDLAANQGLFSLIGVRAGHSVVAVDYDIGSVDQLYSMTRGSSLPIQPAVVDFLTLSGTDRARLGCPIVLALGFTHHLYLVEGMDWPAIARELAALTGRLLITEFKTSTGARHATSPLEQARIDQYRIEAFESALRENFGRVDIVRPEPDANRVLLVCREPVSRGDAAGRETP
jgi:hypothetical protein